MGCASVGGSRAEQVTLRQRDKNMAIHSTPRAIVEWITKGGLYALTAREWLERWDAGKSVFTVEMGGLGPGYEQAIQVCVAEIIRDNIDKPLPTGSFGDWGNASIHRADAKDPKTGRYKLGGLSGAQAGAVRQLAYMYLLKGPARCFQEVSENDPDRTIQVSNFWPHAERQAA